MEEAKEELDAAILQAKNHCISLQQNVWDHEKSNLSPVEDLYVRRYIYAVTVARNIRFFNGFRPSHVPRSKSLTRVFMEQRYHRSKSSPPSMEKRVRSEPKVSLVDDTDGVCAKIEYTETVDESTLVDLIENDKEECAHLARKLPPAKRNWEHLKDIRMQMSKSVEEKGAIIRIGEHLYGFEGIRDLSLKAAADVDRFFGRKPSGDLSYQSPDQFLNHFVEGYSNSFYKSSLSRSVHDLSEWRRKHSDPPILAPAHSYGELHFHDNRMHMEKEAHVAPEPYKEESNYAQIRSTETETLVHTGHPSGLSQYPMLDRLTQAMSNSVHDVQEKLYNTVNVHSGSEPSLNQQHYRYGSLDSRGEPKFQNTAPFECNHHLVRDFEDAMSESSTALVCDADVQPIAPRLQSEGSIRSMTSSRRSMADHLSVDQLSDAVFHTPVSSYSDVVEPAYDPYRNETSHRVVSEDLGTEIHVRRSKELPTHNTASGLGYDGKKSTMTITKTMNITDCGEGSDVSDSETLRPQPSIDSHSDSDATIVANEIEILQKAAELDEAHLHAHVKLIPSQHSWESDGIARQKSNEEAEALLRDVQSTHQALQEQIQRYSSMSNLNSSKKEVIYDPVAKHPEHIYDPVAYAGLHHAHGAIVLSEPVKRPLAVSPPLYDEAAADQSPNIDVLQYSEADLSNHHVYLDNDEHIYEEIGPHPPVPIGHGVSPSDIGHGVSPSDIGHGVSPSIIGQGVTDKRETTQYHYAVSTKIGEGAADARNVKEHDYPMPTTIGEGVSVAKNTSHDYEVLQKVPEAVNGLSPFSKDDYKDVKVISDVNSNVEKAVNVTTSVKDDSSWQGHRVEPNTEGEVVHAKLVHIDYNEDDNKTHMGKVNRTLGKEHQIIRNLDENRGISREENTVRSTEKTTYVKPAVHDAHGGRAFDLNKYEELGGEELPKEEFDRETAAATVAIRRMSRTNQWSEDDERRTRSREFTRSPLSPLTLDVPASPTPRPTPRRDFSPSVGGILSPSTKRSFSAERPEITHNHSYHEGTFGKQNTHDTHGKETKKSHEKVAIFHELTYEGISPRSHETRDLYKTKSAGDLKSGGVLEILRYQPGIDDELKKDQKKPATIGEGVVSHARGREGHTAVVHPATSDTQTVRKGFVHEMARRLEQTLAEETAKKPTPVRLPRTKSSERSWQKIQAAIGTGAVSAGFEPSKASTDVPSVSVHDAIRSFERASSKQHSYKDDIVEIPYETEQMERQRMVSIGTPESINLDEMDLPRWSPNRNITGAASPSGTRESTTVVHSFEERHTVVSHHSGQESSSSIYGHHTETTNASKEAGQTEQEPVVLQRNGSGQRSWPVKTYDHVNISQQKQKMPDIESYAHNGNIPHPEKIIGEENAVLRDWNPRALVRALYEVSYEPRVETKRNRFISMEGHVEVPSDETSTVAELERHWKQLYMRTKEGRLQIFVSHCADEAPAEEIVLSGVDVDANRDERTLTIHGGRDHIRMTLRVQSNVFDKWRHSLLSHAASSQIDAYVKPIPKTFQHLTERVVVLEIGSCSIRGGVLTTEPSLPQSFFPAIAVRTDDGRIIVGEDAYAPEIRHHGEFVRPIQALDPNVERYTMDREVVKECMKKVVKDLNVNPSQYKVLLSIPQNIPVALIGELLTLALKDIGFQGAAITRQPSLILYAYDVTTGVVVDIGDRLNIVPVIDGYVVESAICSIPYGATQVREALRTTLCSNNKGLYSFQSPIEKLILRYVLEQTSYVPDDYTQEEKTSKEVNISLDRFDPLPGMPTKFSIDNSRFLCTEGLFRPKKWGLDTKGLHQLVHEAVQMSPIDSRRTLYRNIYLAGGASLMPGLAEKLEQELAAIVPNSIHTQVHISPWRYNAAYLGAQIVASASTFSDSCISLENLPTFLSHLQSSCF
ncbi:hypothetical protein V3C99_009168 [Haemonchus contortus]